MRGAGAARAGTGDAALVDPSADEGEAAASLRSLTAKVKHHCVKCAVGANVRAVVSLLGQGRGTSSSPLFLGSMEALSAMCMEYPEVSKSLAAGLLSKDHVKTITAAISSQVQGMDGSPDTPEHPPADTAQRAVSGLRCLSCMISGSNAAAYGEAGAGEAILGLATWPGLTGPDVVLAFQTAQVLARGSDPALAHFGCVQSMARCIAVMQEMLHDATVQWAGIKLFAALVRARGEYPSSLGGSSAKLFAANLTEAGGVEVLITCMEQHRTYRDLVPVAFKLLTRLCRCTLKADQLGTFSGTEHLVLQAKSRRNQEPFLCHNAFPETERREDRKGGKVGGEGSNKGEGEEVGATSTFQPGISPARPLLSSRICAGPSAEVSKAPAAARKPRSPFLLPSKHTTLEVLLRAARRWRRRGAAGFQHRCVYDVYCVDVPCDQLFDAAYLMVVGKEYGAVSLGDCRDSGREESSDTRPGEEEEDAAEEVALATAVEQSTILEIEDEKEGGLGGLSEEEEREDDAEAEEEDVATDSTGSATESEGEETLIVTQEALNVAAAAIGLDEEPSKEVVTQGSGRKLRAQHDQGVGQSNSRTKEVAIPQISKPTALAGFDMGGWKRDTLPGARVKWGRGSGAEIPRKIKDRGLLFDSRFEGGNLSRVWQVGDAEYDLMTMPDINTRAGYSGGHTQWYYFAVTNMRRSIAYTFNIVNLLKDDSLYNRGMRPAMFSMKSNDEKQTGWQRVGSRILYYANQYQTESGVPYHTLTFTVSFEHDCDVCYFAHCFPYGYSDLTAFLGKIRNLEHVECATLCKSLAGNEVPFLTITNFKANQQAVSSRRAICITARVHPGETCASWAMEGLLDFLCGNTGRAKILRNSFVFKIVPMLNPDGVISGNYRCSLAGHDLNRRWAQPCPRIHPTIHAAKALIKQTAAMHDLCLYCDLHGHSRKCNMFMYGCSPKSPAQILMERVWPYLLHKATPVFEYDDCTFKVEKSKEGSARVVVWKETNVINSYTLEMSLGGGSFGGKDAPDHPLHYEVADYVHMGQLLCCAILDMYDPGKVKFNTALVELSQIHPEVTREREWQRQKDKRGKRVRNRTV